MPDSSNNKQTIARPGGISEEVGAKEVRKIRARNTSDQTVWFGLGMFGLVGWSVAIPTVLGIALGVWIDMTWPSPFSWTLSLLLGGAALGAMNAWYWVNQEQVAMDQERDQENR